MSTGGQKGRKMGSSVIVSTLKKIIKILKNMINQERKKKKMPLSKY